MSAHANCLPVGAVLGDFEIIGLVGEGGFGIVYLARDTTLDRVVALKEFMPAAFAGRVDGIRVAVRAANHESTYQAGLRSFINEAKMLAKFTHPALVEVYRFWEGNGTAYMAMRFYSGETLRQRLTRGDTSFDEEFIASTMAPIFDAIETLHREQVFHRDIAPDNIMLTEGRPVLLDFGSARSIVGDGTQALTTILKPGYAPIEQYVDDGTMKQGPWTDVYALGGVLYHMATGKLPLQAVSRLLSDPLRTVNEATDDAFSPAFSDAVARAMAVRVEDRLQSVREFSHLLGWITAQPSRVVTLPSAPVNRSTANKNKPIVPLEEPMENTVLEPVVAPAEKVPVTALLDPSAILATDAVPCDWPSDSQEPTYRPEMPKHLSPNATLIIIGCVVVAATLSGYFYVQFSSSQVPKTVALSGSAVLAAPATDLPASAPHVGDSGQVDVPSSVAIVQTGLVNLNIVPWGTVVIDGVARGISNSSQLRQIALPVGIHTIEIAKPNEQTLLKTFEVTATTPYSISHKFK